MATTRQPSTSTLWKGMVINYTKFSCRTAHWQMSLTVICCFWNIQILQIFQLMMKLVAKIWKLDWKMRILKPSLALMTYFTYSRSSFIDTTACTTCPIIGWFSYPESVWSCIVLPSWSKNRLSVPLFILGGLTSDHVKQRANIPILLDIKMI